MFNYKFNTQKQACIYFGHSWSYILRHYKVSYCYDNSGFKGYFISKR